jgi:hypothetical protein
MCRKPRSVAQVPGSPQVFPALGMPTRDAAKRRIETTPVLIARRWR